MIAEGNQVLAIYGSIVGTIALGINVFSYLHSKKKDSVHLAVECKESDKAPKELKAMEASEGKPAMDCSMLALVYVVTVRNTGNTEAHIQEVGVVDDSGIEHCALVPGFHPQILSEIAQSNSISILPKAMMAFNIYIRQGEPLFAAKKCFVIDQQQKRWDKRLKLQRLGRLLNSTE